MAWIEHQRARRGVVFRDDVDAGLRWGRFSIATLSYESEIDSGDHDAEIDCTPERVLAGGNDGWRIIQNGFHYSLGRPAGRATDGWVGFGGRQGQNWLFFRLARVGYLHWDTRTWVDVGSDPTYDRGELSQTGRSKIVGPNGETQVVESVAEWRNLWSTPGGGELWVRWRVNGDQLKEDVVIDQVGREWLQANRGLSWVRDQLGDQTVQTDELWFGFVFQIDASDIPRVVKNGVLQDLQGDFDDGDGNPIELRDSLDRLLTLLPIDDVTAGIRGRGNGGIDSSRLRKRIWRDGSDTYLLVGVRVDVLVGMRAGPLVFDPTFNVANTNRDGGSEESGNNEMVQPSQALWGNFYVGQDGANPGELDGGWIYVTTIPQGATIATCTITVTRESADYSSGFQGDWDCYDVDTPDDFNASHEHQLTNHHATTGNPVQDDSWANAATHTSPSLVTPCQAVVNRAGFGGTIGFVWMSDGAGPDGWFHWSDYTDSAADAADLTVTWSEGARRVFVTHT